MVANSKMKYKPEAMLKVIRGLVLDFVLYFVTVTLAQSTTLHKK